MLQYDQTNAYDTAVHSSSTYNLQNKLKTVAYMRQSAQLSKQRLQTAQNLLNESDETIQSDKQNETKIDSKSTFGIRLCFVLLIFISLIMLHKSTNLKLNDIFMEVQRYIHIDYSENIFDFIQKISYT